jgi:sugar lactone lactonase YvrE
VRALGSAGAVDRSRLSSGTGLPIRGLLVLGLAIAGLAVAASPALADRTLESQITGAPALAPVPGPFSNPWGLAVDGGDNLWVGNTEGGGLVDKFDSGGNWLAQGTGSAHWSGAYTQSIAFSNASDHAYVADSDHDELFVLNSDASYKSTIKGAWGTGCCYIYTAADNSSGPAAGDLYVSGVSSHVYRIDGSGTPAKFTAGASAGSAVLTGADAPSGSFGGIGNLAVDAVGNLYVVDQGNKVVDKFAPTGAFLASYDGEGAPESFSQITGVAVDPTNGDLLFVDTGHGVVDEFEESGDYVGRITGPEEGTPFGYLNGGIATDSNGVVYVSDGGGKVVDVFSPNFILPKTTYQPITNQTQTSGTLHATIDPNGGGNVLTCVFQYGTTPSYGSSVPCSPPAPYSSTTAVSADVSGLTTETAYHYRVLVTNSKGTKKGSDQTFLPHAVAGLTTLAPTEVARNTATLNATFNGNGEDTHYFFEWGTTTAYGNTTAAPPGADAGAPTVTKPLSFHLEGLQVETVYHYRVIASNAAGTSTGDDQSFITVAAVENATTGPATEITATTALLNASYTGNGEDTHYYFEWGSDTSYGRTTAAPPGADDGSPSGARAISFELIGLEINHPYHFRLVAGNPAGTTYGADQSFTTLGVYELSGALGTEGSGDGQLMAPKDVAADRSTGAVYVADAGNHRVVKFDSSGAFLSAWGEGVDDGSPVAQVCTSGCQAGTEGVGVGAFTDPAFIEVDNSGSPSAGDVYVADLADGVVQKFDPSGHAIASWGEGGKIDLSGSGAFTGITVDEVGNLIAGGDQLPYYWTTIAQDGLSRTRFATSPYQLYPLGTGLDVNSVGTGYEPTPDSAVRTLTKDGQEGAEYRLGGTAGGLLVDRSTSDLYVSTGQEIAIFAASHPCGTRFQGGCPQTGTLGVGQLSSAAGLAMNPATKVFYAADAGAGRIVRFSPLPTPTVVTGGAERSMTAATLSGHVDPGSASVSSCYFQYGTDTGYSLGTVPCNPGGAIGAPTDVHAEITGLTPSTTYHYRLVAIRSDGKGLPAYGHDQSVTPGSTLLPTIDGTSSSGVTEAAATLSAEINPNLAPTVYRFEYGINTEYGQRTATSESIGEDGVNHPVNATIGDLISGTTYHFRVLAINVNGTTSGPDQVLHTAGGVIETPTPPPVIPPPGPAPDETSPPLTCGKGFHAKGGKCVKKKRPRHRHRKHHPHGRGGKQRG